MPQTLYMMFITFKKESEQIPRYLELGVFAVGTVQAFRKALEDRLVGLRIADGYSIEQIKIESIEKQA